MLAGDLYDPTDAELVAARSRARDLCQTLNATREAEVEETANTVRAVRHRRQYRLDATALLLRLRHPTSVSANACSSISIAWCSTSVRSASETSRCSVRQCKFTPPRIPLDAKLRRRQEFGKPIEIGSDVWVGGGAIVLPGVRIGSRSVIGTGSVVTRDIPDNVFATGNPCRIVRKITE